MKIRTKVILLLTALFAVLAGAEFYVQQRILRPSFADLERDAAREDMDRVAYALGRELDLLGITVRDWGNWSDTYAFMQDHNPSFLRANLTDESIASLRVNAVTFIDLDGRFVWSVGRAPGSRRPLALDFLERGALPEHHPWRAAVAEGRKAAGLIDTDRGVMMAVMMPILNGFGEGPHRGMVLMGRLITAEEIKRIGEQAHVSLDRVSQRMPGQPAPARTETLIEHDDMTEVVRTFDDVENAPILALRIEVPRQITARGRHALIYGSTFLIGAGGIVLVALILLLNRAVLSPLARITDHAVSIGRGEDANTRLELERSDELGELALEFDRMVASLAVARRELADRSYDAGIAEHASGTLHNLGNAMTPLAVKVATLQSTLRAAPVADVDRVLSELGRPGSDAARTADLETFLRLTARELAESITRAQKDADALARHTGAIQQLLIEQASHSRSPPMLEDVRLESVIDASVQLVPPALLARLVIEIDPSVPAIGPLRLPRITLQQIFQNLIVNAAEAVGESGRGVLRIAAQAIQTPAGLDIRFTDDGVGIAAPHLERIFERGFSTKPPASNRGIGLHWCSNALNALGGSMQADSAGPGRGTVFHIHLPLERAADAARQRVA